MKAFQPTTPVRHWVGRVVSPAILLTAALLTIAWRAGAQTVDGPVVGQVTNGSSDADVPDGLVVTLHTFAGMEEVGTYSTTVSADNAFRFSGVPFDEGQTLVARTVHA
ncbi:MAG: hypothetical protein PVG71_02315, partial [Anaerolineae bacterium]